MKKNITKDNNTASIEKINNVLTAIKGRCVKDKTCYYIEMKEYINTKDTEKNIVNFCKKNKLGAIIVQKSKDKIYKAYNNLIKELVLN
jgi:hypothetical protein